MVYYAFIVGVNQDWPEQRCSHGDIGLARCLVGHHVQLPKEHLVEVYDEKATRSNILHSLENLLDLRRRRNNRLSQQSDTSDTLLFYYGGHGKEREFCTGRHSVKNGEMQKEPWIKHLDIIDLLESKFKGGTVWCIIDCCHSGGFGQAVVQKNRDSNSLSVNYGCIMSCAPADEAGLEWTMTECFIRAFTGDFFSNKYQYYLSTKNGKHPIKDKMLPPVNRTNENLFSQPTWEQVIEYLADEMARIKANRLTTLFLGKGMEDGKLLKGPCIFHENASNISCSTICIPRDETWMESFRRRCYAVNDGVVVKYVGNATDHRVDGSISTARPRIGWFPGLIISINQSNDCSVDKENPNSNHATVCVELHDAITQSRWTATLSLNRILGGLPFGFGFDSLSCATTISSMAKTLAFYDTSFPSGSRVKALWKDGEFYSATSLCYQDLDWDALDIDSSVGPCVPVRWDDDHSVSFIPTVACIVKSSLGGNYNSSSEDKVALNEESEIESSPLDVMMTSLRGQGQTLNRTFPICDSSGVDDEEGSWEAYDAEDCEWTPVTLMNTVNVSDLPLKVLAYHMCYRESGSLSVIYWESDSTLSLVPNTYLRRRRLSWDDDGNDDNGENRICADDVETTDHEDVKKYTTENCSSSMNNSSRILRLFSLSFAIFGLGVLVIKSKR